MAIRDLFVSAQPFVVGIGLPIVAIAAGVIVPVQFSQQHVLGVVETRTDNIDKKLDDVKATLAGDLKEVKASVVNDVKDLRASVDAVNRRFAEKDVDPTTILAKLLGASDVDAKAVPTIVIGGDLVAFPRTEPLRQKFIAAGYQLKAVTPTISGFTINLTASKNLAPAAP